MRGLEEVLPSQPAEETNPADFLLSDFCSPEPGDSALVLSKPSGRWYSVMVALAH